MADRTPIPGTPRYERELQSFVGAASPNTHGSWSEELRKFSSSIEDLRQQVAQERAEVERLRAHNAAAELELNIVRRMFVVLSQLHLADSEYNSMAIVHDVLTNFVGTEEFACVMFRKPAHQVLFSMGVTNARIHALTGGQGSPFEQLMRQGRLVSNESVSPDTRDYLMAFPLMDKTAVVGAIVVFRLLTQKNGVEPLDRALFDLLTKHAAPAFAKFTALGSKEDQQ